MEQKLSYPDIGLQIDKPNSQFSSKKPACQVTRDSEGNYNARLPSGDKKHMLDTYESLVVMGMKRGTLEKIQFKTEPPNQPDPDFIKEQIKRTYTAMEHVGVDKSKEPDFEIPAEALKGKSKVDFIEDARKEYLKEKKLGSSSSP